MSLNKIASTHFLANCSEPGMGNEKNKSCEFSWIIIYTCMIIYWCFAICKTKYFGLKCIHWMWPIQNMHVKYHKGTLCRLWVYIRNIMLHTPVQSMNIFYQYPAIIHGVCSSISITTMNHTTMPLSWAPLMWKYGVPYALWLIDSRWEGMPPVLASINPEIYFWGFNTVS